MHIEKNKEKIMVENIKIPNCKKKDNCAMNINMEAPKVVHAPKNTDTAISSSMSLTRENLSLCKESVYPSAK
jgi:hypothetical protein